MKSPRQAPTHAHARPPGGPCTSALGRLLPRTARQNVLVLILSPWGARPGCSLPKMVPYANPKDSGRTGVRLQGQKAPPFGTTVP